MSQPTDSLQSRLNEAQRAHNAAYRRTLAQIAAHGYHRRRRRFQDLNWPVLLYGALVIGCLVALFGCAPEVHPAPAPRPTVVFAQTLTVTVIEPGRGWHGGVACERGVPVIEYMGKYHPRTGELLPPGNLLRAENVRHEAMHFVQLAADGDCTQTARRWLANPREWLEAEAQALCTGLKVYRGAARAARKAELLALLLTWHRGYDGQAADNALARWCDGEPQ